MTHVFSRMVTRVVMDGDNPVRMVRGWALLPGGMFQTADSATYRVEPAGNVKRIGKPKGTKKQRRDARRAAKAAAKAAPHHRPPSPVPVKGSR